MGALRKKTSLKLIDTKSKECINVLQYVKILLQLEVPNHMLKAMIKVNKKVQKTLNLKILKIKIQCTLKKVYTRKRKHLKNKVMVSFLEI